MLETAAGDASVAEMAMVHRDLGVVYTEAGRKGDAANELHKAIALDPKDVSPHWRLGKLYQSMGKKDEAKQEFAIASAMTKENDKPLAQEIGYEACFSALSGVIEPHHRGQILPREAMPYFRSLTNLELHLSGCLDWFYRVKRRVGLL